MFLFDTHLNNQQQISMRVKMRLACLKMVVIWILRRRVEGCRRNKPKRGYFEFTYVHFFEMYFTLKIFWNGLFSKIDDNDFYNGNQKICQINTAFLRQPWTGITFKNDHFWPHCLLLHHQVCCLHFLCNIFLLNVSII